MDKEDLALLGPALDSYLAEFADVAIAPTRKLIAAYCRGQLGPLERKSVMPMAREAGIAPRTLQELLSLHRWDEDLLVDTLQRHVWRLHGGGEPVATILDTWCPKKGTRTPGVGLQPCGTSGKTRNCVLLVHLGIAVGEVHTLLDSDLFLPKAWAESPERREEARIPDSARYRTRTQIALDLLDHAAANGIRFGWVYFGIDYASDPQFLKELSARRLKYVAPPPSLRPGERGTSARWITNSENGTSPEAAVRVVEAGLETARVFTEGSKSIGLDHFEVRSFLSLKRHLALSAASLLFLQERVLRSALRTGRPALKFRA